MKDHVYSSNLCLFLQLFVYKLKPPIKYQTKLQARYMSISVHKIDEDFSLHRTYILFRTLGLCHLVVTDIRNRVVGVITRKVNNRSTYIDI